MYTADGALEEILFMLLRMRELAVQATNDTLTSQDREYIQLEIDRLKEEIDKVAATLHLLDADVMNEILELTKMSILVYSEAAMTAQANLRPQVVLSMLK